MAGRNVGVVVPTLGDRTVWMSEAIRSIQGSEAYVVVVAPRGAAVDTQMADHVVWRDRYRDDLSGSINAGIRAMPSTIDFVTWLNDDDVLKPNALDYGVETLCTFSESSFVYGRCDYVDVALRTLWVNRVGRVAGATQWIGPDLVPQPGALIRRVAWEEVGGLDESLQLAFDLDLFLRLRRSGPPHFDRRIESLVRWHSDAKSNRERGFQVLEAELVRLRNARGLRKQVIRVVAPLVRWSTLAAPSLLLRSRDS